MKILVPVKRVVDYGPCRGIGAGGRARRSPGKALQIQEGQGSVGG